MPQIIRELFEIELAKYLNVPHVKAVNSGTSALVAAFYAADVKNWEVITTPFTFYSAVNAIVLAGGIPRFVDIRREDSLIDVSLIENAITDSTKVIVATHLFGRCCDMDKICEVANKYNLFVVEDAAQSFGQVYKDRKLGTIGDVGCFSFYKTKNFSTFEGGACAVRRDSKLDFDTVASICDPKVSQGRHIGFSFRMSELSALVGYEGLRLHRESITTELGKNAEGEGYYPYVVYNLPAYEGKFCGNCPVAEEIANKIKEQRE